MEYKIYDTSNKVQSSVTGNWDSGYIDPVGSSFKFCLFAPAQGYKVDQYIGQEVLVHKIELRLGLCMPYGAVSDPDVPQSIFTRMVLFQDKQTSFGRIDGSEVFDSTGSTDNVVVQDFDIDTLDRIDILWEKMYCHNIDSITSILQPPPIPITYVWPSKYISDHIIIDFKKPVVVKFAPIAAVANIASIVNNSFHLIAMSTSTPNLLNSPGISIVYNCRTYFTDK